MLLSTVVVMMIITNAATSAFAGEYVAEEIGNDFLPNAISKNGEFVVGDNAANGGVPDQALLWSKAIGLIPISPVGYSTYGSGVNNVGFAVGTWVQDNSFTYTPTSGFKNLGDAGPYPYTQLKTTNDNNYSLRNSTSFAGPPTQVYLIAPDGSAIPLGTAPGVNNPIVSPGQTLNDSLEATGGSYAAAGDPWIWSPLIGMTPIPLLPGDVVGQGTAINNLGEVVGSDQSASGVYSPFSYFDGTLTALGTLGGPSAEARGLNDNGDIFGWSTTTDGSQVAFADIGGQMTDLNSEVLNIPGVTLDVAIGGDNSGDIIAESTGGDAYLLTPASAPDSGSSLILMGIGVLSLAACRARCRA
jgi:probable HAF family extracellular repeat protein